MRFLLVIGVEGRFKRCWDFMFKVFIVMIDVLFDKSGNFLRFICYIVICEVLIKRIVVYWFDVF